MDWDDLRSFLEIARARTLSGAARALGLRQSTMSRRLAALEARAGARLLTRTPSGYALTALGEAVLGNAERMEAEAIAIERAVQGRDVALSGLVRVTTVDVMASRLLPPAIAALQARYPAISVDVLTEGRSLSLSRREADIAIRMTRFEGNELFTRRLGLAGNALYAAPSYLAAHGAQLTGGHHAIITVLEDQTHMPESAWLAQMVPGTRVALRSNSRETQMQAAIAGLGVACLGRYQGDSAAGLVRLDSPPAPTREIWLGVHADLRQMPRIRAMIEVIDAQFAAQRHLLDPA